MNGENDFLVNDTYKSPTERLKNEIIKLLFENVSHNSKSRNNADERFAFCTKTKDLSILLDKYTPREKRIELLNWYKQLDTKINEVKESKDYTLTVDKKNEMILELQYKYATEVHIHNSKVILNSPIIESDIEGELDINDEEILAVINYRSSRQDDGKLEFKH